ncbi:hypothetical protein HYH03_002465 [Edaphochlamys debaryana]|uniref:Protein kinase domain-containing protein n=1 Tax=Edaphochlamys debaryana TaxID=47281 RepID=A0A835YBA5_9CHLO|nr:hypothetical protein HYH03_002465 [Edaphochlamys debaryana]|eukprot:KAG2499518.1 hypothetical protein HYH03_002465 [Edaphochlamys debaryana]
MASPAFLLTPGATVEIVSANLTGVRLAKAGSSVGPLSLLSVSVQPTALLALRDVFLETDCATLAEFQRWYTATRPANASLDASGDLYFAAHQQTGIALTACTITCRRPALLDSSSPAAGGAGGTVLAVRSDLDLYNAISLADSYTAPVTFAVQASINLTSPLWSAQAVLSRSAALVGDIPAGSGLGGRGRPVLDLQDLTSVVYLAEGVVLSARGLAFSNAGMVFGTASLPYTGLGLVSCFMWFFDLRRSLAPRPPNQLQLTDCDIIVYPEDLEHMELWTVFVTTTTGPMAQWAAPFRTGVNEVQADPTASPALRYSVLDAYGMRFANVSLLAAGSPAAPLALTARRAGVPLYQLYTPLNTTVVPVWTQADLKTALANAQRFPQCSPISNTTLYLHLFTNLTIDPRAWPTGGYGLSCNVTISGTPSRPGSTWLNFNLIPRFVTLTNRAALSFRSLTLLNMPSSSRTYDLSSLDSTTLPLWPVARTPLPSPDPLLASLPPALALRDCALVLPLEEYRAVAGVLGLAEGRFPSPALNASLAAYELVYSVAHRITLSSFTGWGMQAVTTSIADPTNYPDAVLLSNTVYNTAAIAASPPPPPSASPAPPPPRGNTAAVPSNAATGGGDTGPSSTAVVAIAVAVPLGAGVLGAAAGVMLYFTIRRRKRRRTRSLLDGAAGVTAVGAHHVNGGGNTPVSRGSGATGSKGLGTGGVGSGGGSGGAAAVSASTPGSRLSPDSAAAGSAATDGAANGNGNGWNAARASDVSVLLGEGEETDAGSEAPPPLHVELHQLILDFAREIEDQHLTIQGPLGSGGFATVYRGTWRGIDVAVKVIEFQDRAAVPEGDQKLQTRAMTEAAIAANIQHPNVVTTYSYDIRAVQPHEPATEAPTNSTLLGIGPAPEGAAAAAAAAAAAGPGAVGPGAAGNALLLAGGVGGVGGARPHRVSASSGHSGMGGAASPARGSRRGSASGSVQQLGAGAAVAVPSMWRLYLIQEFCEVGSLRVALENHMLKGLDGQPNLPMILRLALDVVRGLQHLHRKNIVHGDLTPGNILLKADLSRPGRYVGKLADFGLSVKMNPAQTSVDNNRTGTPFYASPEVRQHGNLTKASDVFALGVVLWEMYHGRPCYQRVRGVKNYVHATGYPSFPPACPGPYAELAVRCLRRSLEDRPALAEAHEVLRSLLMLISGPSSASYAPSEATTATHSRAGSVADWQLGGPTPLMGLGPAGMGQVLDNAVYGMGSLYGSRASSMYGGAAAAGGTAGSSGRSLVGAMGGPGALAAAGAQLLAPQAALMAPPPDAAAGPRAMTNAEWGPPPGPGAGTGTATGCSSAGSATPALQNCGSWPRDHGPGPGTMARGSRMQPAASPGGGGGVAAGVAAPPPPGGGLDLAQVLQAQQILQQYALQQQQYQQQHAQQQLAALQAQQRYMQGPGQAQAQGGAGEGAQYQEYDAQAAQAQAQAQAQQDLDGQYPSGPLTLAPSNQPRTGATGATTSGASGSGSGTGSGTHTRGRPGSHPQVDLGLHQQQAAAAAGASAGFQWPQLSGQHSPRHMQPLAQAPAPVPPPAAAPQQLQGVGQSVMSPGAPRGGQQMQPEPAQQRPPMPPPSQQHVPVAAVQHADVAPAAGAAAAAQLTSGATSEPFCTPPGSVTTTGPGSTS